MLEKTSDHGEVIVGCTITPNMEVKDDLAENSNSKMLDGSAVKIVQKLDNWNPGIQRNKKVPVDLTVPVKFE